MTIISEKNTCCIMPIFYKNPIIVRMMSNNIKISKLIIQVLLKEKDNKKIQMKMRNELMLSEYTTLYQLCNSFPISLSSTQLYNSVKYFSTKKTNKICKLFINYAPTHLDLCSNTENCEVENGKNWLTILYSRIVNGRKILISHLTPDETKVFKVGLSMHDPDNQLHALNIGISTIYDFTKIQLETSDERPNEEHDK